ncbi:MAG: hypothetical protein FD143_3657, partial [Ignavibacteria bacterium]
INLTSNAIFQQSVDKVRCSGMNMVGHANGPAERLEKISKI